MEHALLTTLTELAASGDSDAIAAALRDLDVGAPSLIDALTARDLGETLHTAPEHVRPGSWVMEPLAVCAEWPQIARAVSEVLARQAPTADFVASTCERALEAPSPPLLCAIGLLAEHPAWRAWEAAAPRIFRAIAWRIAHEADTLLYAHTATMSARCIRSIETAGRFGMTVALAVPVSSAQRRRWLAWTCAPASAPLTHTCWLACRVSVRAVRRPRALGALLWHHDDDSKAHAGAPDDLGSGARVAQQQHVAAAAALAAGTQVHSSGRLWSRRG